jgi:Fe-S cluster assembly protein SufD
VAQIDPDQLYYLRSRGMPEAQARRLIIDGFLQELAERTDRGPLRDALSEALDRRLAEIVAPA